MTTDVIQRRVFDPGETVFLEGEIGMRAYIVEDGEVEIYKSKDGQEVTIGIVTNGGLFGEMSLIDGEPRMASARVVKQSVLLSIKKNDFMKKVDQSDPLVRKIFKILIEAARRNSEL